MFIVVEQDSWPPVRTIHYIKKREKLLSQMLPILSQQPAAKTFNILWLMLILQTPQEANYCLRKTWRFSITP